MMIFFILKLLLLILIYLFILEVVFVIIISICLLFHMLIILFLIIHIGCWIEYQTLLIKIDTRYNNASIFHKIGIIVAGTAFMLWCTSDYYTINDLNIHALGWWILLLTLFVFPENLQRSP